MAKKGSSGSGGRCVPPSKSSHGTPSSKKTDKYLSPNIDLGALYYWDRV